MAPIPCSSGSGRPAQPWPGHHSPRCKGALRKGAVHSFGPASPWTGGREHCWGLGLFWRASWPSCVETHQAHCPARQISNGLNYPALIHSPVSGAQRSQGGDGRLLAPNPRRSLALPRALHTCSFIWRLFLFSAWENLPEPSQQGTLCKSARHLLSSFHRHSQSSSKQRLLLGFAHWQEFSLS